MAFISSCPKCQKQVLVPDGACPDAVVRCPICSAEYSMGEILASAPPALIVIHPGSTAATISRGGIETAPAELFAAAVAGPIALPSAESSEDAALAALGVEPGLDHAEPLLFGDEAQLATSDEHASELSAEPLSEEGHGLAAESAEGAALGRRWGGFKDEAAHEEGAVGAAEPDHDEGLGHVDFAAITGKAAPGSAVAAAACDAAVTLEPPKKKKRKREANLVVRFVGMGFAGLLALACVLGFAAWQGMPLDFLPSWAQFHFNKPSTRADSPKPGGQPNGLPTVKTPAANANPEANAKSSDAGGQPGDQGKTAVGEGEPKATPNKPATSDADKGSELAMNGPPKEGTKPAASSNGKIIGSDPGPFDENPGAKPESDRQSNPTFPSLANRQRR